MAEARKEINDWAGRQFDPKIVEVFLGMDDKIWEDLPQRNKLSPVRLRRRRRFLILPAFRQPILHAYIQ